MSEQTTSAESALYGPGLTDVRMMIVAHTSFRRELGLSPRAVRSVPAGHSRRVAEIADHVDLFLSLLHHHHTIEDDLLWEKLLDRVPGELAPLVHTMESQHEAVAELLEQATHAISQWRHTNTIKDAESLADLLSRLASALNEHLDAEESLLLPIGKASLWYIGEVTSGGWLDGAYQVPQGRCRWFQGFLSRGGPN